MTPPTKPEAPQALPPHMVPGRHWHALENGRIRCDLCPRACDIPTGQRGLCFVRANVGGQMMLTTYGRSSGFCIDPVEKKPLNHFLPGTPILSFGTAGCNLTCKFCQNWEISKARKVETLNRDAAPDTIAQAAQRTGCRSVAYTYNDPVIMLEYAMDTAKACHAKGLRNVAVTAGYVEPAARADFFSVMDAANVDLKAFTEGFYKNLASASLKPVLDTLKWLVHESNVWVEITTLLIPTQNDADEELQALSAWVAEELTPEVPVHFSAFHPDHKMMDLPRTPHETLKRARAIAQAEGLRHVYLGNVHDKEADATYCTGCGKAVIERDWYQLDAYHLTDSGACKSCGTQMAGLFDGPVGDWGRKRVPIDPARFASPAPQQVRLRSKQAVPQAKPKPAPAPVPPTQAPTSAARPSMAPGAGQRVTARTVALPVQVPKHLLKKKS
ncbi:MAG: AmmeMemoRadiSam system radical SAM enzyme [Rhodospirillaceae bacterium]